MTHTSRLVRFERWAGRILKLKTRNSIKLATAALGAVVLFGGAFKSAEYIFRVLGRASIDAGEVAKIRKDVENQRDTISSVARDANAAREQMQKAFDLSTNAQSRAEEARTKTADIAGLVEEANKGVIEIKRTAEFSFLLARVTADDRIAFDELRGIANQQFHEFHDLALAAVLRVVGDLGRTAVFSNNINWTTMGVDTNTVDWEELMAVFHDAPVFNKPHLVSGIAALDRFPKYDRLSFLDTVIRSATSVEVLEAACRAMNRDAKIDRNVYAYRSYLEWWTVHARDYSSASEPVTSEPSIESYDSEWPDVSLNQIILEQPLRMMIVYQWPR